MPMPVFLRRQGLFFESWIILILCFVGVVLTAKSLVESIRPYKGYRGFNIILSGISIFKPPNSLSPKRIFN
jgi:hypothetical protein